MAISVNTLFNFGDYHKVRKFGFHLENSACQGRMIGVQGRL